MMVKEKGNPSQLRTGVEPKTIRFLVHWAIGDSRDLRQLLKCCSGPKSRAATSRNGCGNEILLQSQFGNFMVQTGESIVFFLSILIWLNCLMESVLANHFVKSYDWLRLSSFHPSNCRVDNFILVEKAVGSLTKLGIKRDEEGLFDDWKLDLVTIIELF